MEETLKQLGFKSLTGPLWQHSGTNLIISSIDVDKPEDIVPFLLRMGAEEQNALIRGTLGIKP